MIVHLYMGQYGAYNDWCVQAADAPWENPAPFPIVDIPFGDGVEVMAHVGAEGWAGFTKFEYAQAFLADWCKALVAEGYEVRVVRDAYPRGY